MYQVTFSMVQKLTEAMYYITEFNSVMSVAEAWLMCGF